MMSLSLKKSNGSFRLNTISSVVKTTEVESAEPWPEQSGRFVGLLASANLQREKVIGMIRHLTVCRGRIWGGENRGDLTEDVTDEFAPVGKDVGYVALELLLRDMIARQEIGCLSMGIARWFNEHFDVVFRRA